MTTRYLRTTWLDLRDHEVHAVVLDLRALGVAEVHWPFLHDVAGMSISLADMVTVCGLELPRSFSVRNFERVTCEACLEAEGASAVRMATWLMTPQAVPA